MGLSRESSMEAGIVVEVAKLPPVTLAHEMLIPGSDTPSSDRSAC